MKNLLALLSAILLSSCSTYYYSTVESTDLAKANDGHFIFDNDTLKVSYSFYGEDAPITLNIYNKMDTPIYIDWQKSVVVIGNTPTSYQNTSSVLNGNSQTSTYFRQKNPASNNFGDNKTLTRGLCFIAPKSEIENTYLKITNYVYNSIPDDTYGKELFYTGLTSNGLEVKTKSFSSLDSPLNFRGYLTFYTSDDITNSKKTTYDHRFYISKLSKTNKVSPSKMHEYTTKRADFFYVKKLQKTKRKTEGAIAINIIDPN